MVGLIKVDSLQTYSLIRIFSKDITVMDNLMNLSPSLLKVEQNYLAKKQQWTDKQTKTSKLRSTMFPPKILSLWIFLNNYHGQVFFLDHGEPQASHLLCTYYAFFYIH